MRLGQADGAGQIELLLSQLIFRRNDALLLRLQLDLRAKNVDAWHNAALFQTHGPVINRLRRFQLRPRGIHAAGSRDSFKIKVGCNQGHELPDILLRIIAGLHPFRCCSQFM